MEVELNIYTYTLLAILLSLLFLPLFFHQDPDIHPIALQHQSQSSGIRQKKESAIYRNVATPHGTPLKKGLGLPGEKRWETRDGDLRDIWNTHVEKGPGKVISVKGKDVTEVPDEKITQWIHILGSYLSQNSPTKRIALHLPNDIENLVISFACAFYDLPLILLPYPSEAKTITSMLSKTQADLVVTAAGVIPLNSLQSVSSLKHILYVVEPASRKLDWATPPGSRVHTQTFHELLEANHTTTPPPIELDPTKPAIITCTPILPSSTLEINEFSTRNLISAISAQLSSLPPAERFTQKDTFLPLDCLSLLYPRILTYTALFSGCTLALTSTSGKKADLLTATSPLSPTILVASSHALLTLIRQTKSSQIELWHNLITFFQSRTLASGRIPRGNWLTRINDYTRPSLGSPHSLRLVFTHELALSPDTQPLNSPDLNDLRQFLAARIIYALCSPRVAGAVCAQNCYDYRLEWPEKMPSKMKGIGRKCTHFGPPLPGCEVWVREVEGYNVGKGEGGIWARGPVVAGEKGREKGVAVGVMGRWRGDGCLEFV